MKLIGLLLLLALVSLAEGEVVTSFKDSCPQFFFDQNKGLPTVLQGAQYRQICQKYKGQYRYATLYDTENKIPIYSAYKYSGYKKTQRKRAWMIEPQLGGPEMCGEAMNYYQAVNKDYKDLENYTRGHLYPKLHNKDQDQTTSTFTLTNAAPQTLKDNNNWVKVENRIRKYSESKCEGSTASVVTGVIPGEHDKQKRLNIPTHFWSAVCCKEKDKDSLTSEGYILKMTGDGNATYSTHTIGQLNEELGKLYFRIKDGFHVFGTVEGCS